MAGVRDRVGKRVAEFLSGQRVILDDISPDVGALLDPLGDFMAGGKRLRAMFLYWGWRSAGRPDGEEIVSAAAAMEFLQACALVHDDVMDRSDSRRGRPAIHRQFESLHESTRWAGGSADFGAAAAILIGDLCLSWADELLLASGLPSDGLSRGKPVYDVMRTELMAGQYLDMLEQVRRNDRVEAALQVATYKSAKYTIERPLHLGAAMAGAAPAAIEALRHYGVSLGRAFQLRDDLLGVYGDPRETGKPAGDDLREGKRTVLVTLALAELGDADRDRFAAGLESGDPAGVPRLRGLLDTTSARAQMEDLIATEAAAARAALTEAPLDPQAAEVLAQLVDVAVRRGS